MPKLPSRKPPPIPPRGSKNHAPSHAFSNGKGGVWAHPGRAVDCRKPECVQWHREQTPKHASFSLLSPAPPVESEFDYVDSSEPPPDPLAPCPLTGGEHRWRWGDDGNDHSGDVCKCGAYEE